MIAPPEPTSSPFLALPRGECQRVRSAQAPRRLTTAQRAYVTLSEDAWATAAPAAGPTVKPRPQQTLIIPRTAPWGRPACSAPSAASGKETAHWAEIAGAPATYRAANASGESSGGTSTAHATAAPSSP